MVEAKSERPLWFNKGVEMALLAPTAINQQKFVIPFGKKKRIGLYYEPAGTVNHATSGSG